MARSTVVFAVISPYSAGRAGAQRLSRAGVTR